MSMRGLLALLGLLCLTGCLGSSGASGVVQRDVMRTVTLYDGDVVVRGPAGYCIDRRSLRRRDSQSFVMVASCESLSGVRGNEVEPVIMTLTVLPGQAGAARPNAREIAASMPELTVIDTVDQDGLSLVHFANGGDRALEGKDPKHWRGAMAVNGHLVGLALYARSGSPSAGNMGQKLLSQLAANTKAGSPVRPLIVPQTVPETVSGRVPAPSAPPPGSLGALLGGLFPDSS